MKKLARRRKLSTRVTRPATPHLRRAPRGRPFAKGNDYGRASRFPKGVSGNPGGRPRSAKVGDATRFLLALKTTDAIPKGSNAEELALKLFRLAKRGNLSAIREVIDRAEGRPAVSVSINEGPDPVVVLIEEMRKESKRRGLPEAYAERQLHAEESDDQQEETEAPQIGAGNAEVA